MSEELGLGKEACQVSGARCQKNRDRDPGRGLGTPNSGFQIPERGEEGGSSATRSLPLAELVLSS